MAHFLPVHRELKTTKAKFSAIPTAFPEHALEENKTSRVRLKAGLAFKHGRLVWAGKENDLIISHSFLLELLAWLPYLVALYIVRTKQKLTQCQRPSICFSPASPGPWYMLVGAAAWGGVDIQPAFSSASLRVYFDDVTQAAASDDVPLNAINGLCRDITKSHVATIFASVFGYPLAVDPTLYRGPMVEKPEINGIHGGRIIAAPAIPRSGFVYQKLVDTADENNCCSDLRTPCIGGVPILVWRKRKSPAGRFNIHNDSAQLLQPEEVFSADELELIMRFNEAIGLECGGLDILRDRSDGRIYIVDANKTDVGPLIILSWRDKMKSMEILGAALQTWLLKRENLVAK